MKKTSTILVLILLLTINTTQAQENKTSNFSLIAYGAIGYAIMENDNEPSYNLNSNSGEILVNYHVDEEFGFATGIGMNELSGNGFNSFGNFYHERTTIKVPLLVTFTSSFSDKFNVFAVVGGYGQNIIKDEYYFLNNTQTDIYDGWSFGFQLGAGFIYQVSENFGLGINYSGQADLSKFESNNNTGINDKQKMKNLNSFGLIFMLKV